MARTFGALGTDVIDCGSGSSIDNLNPLTLAGWLFVTAAGDAIQKSIAAKTAVAGGWHYLLDSNTGPVANGLRLFVTRATTDSDALSSAALALDTWIFAACTYSDADGPRLYTATGASPIAEVTYNKRIVGTGARIDDAAGNMLIGNVSFAQLPFKGRLAHQGAWNKILTLGEMEEFRRGRGAQNANLRGLWPLWGVASPELDLSGNLNNGTVTGATAADHAPVGRYAQPRRFTVASEQAEATLERFIKGNSNISYPELFIKSDSDLEALRTFYLKGAPALQADFARYVKGESELQQLVDLYLKGEVAFFGGDVQRYLKGDSSLARLDHAYIRGQVDFAYSALYLKGLAALVKAPNLGDLGDSPPSTKSGVLSRQYLSIASVKKDVS